MVAAVLSITACATIPLKPSVGASGIAGTNWTLRALDGAPAPDGDTSATLAFGRDGSVVGTLACNSAGGVIEWSADGDFTGLDAPIIITTVGCGNQDAQIALGDRFWSRLRPGSSWTREADTLAIRFADGGRATFAPFRRR